MCGEQSADQMAAFCNQGSSPRVRGADEDGQAVDLVDGIIPARAGSSVPRSGPCRPGGDHPRVRGEQNAHSVRTVPVLGSSPRVRGTVDGERDALTRRGIIPARAGSRRRHRGRLPGHRDHPRACGEQFLIHFEIVSR